VLEHSTEAGVGAVIREIKKHMRRALCHISSCQRSNADLYGNMFMR
jgi:hypothetical protein